MLRLKIKKLSLKGAGLTRFKGKKVYVWGVLPEEEVEAEIVKRKRSYFEAIATKIIKPSSLRIDPKEDHFLSCSPWQIIPWEKEVEIKKQLAIEYIKSKLGLEVEPKIFSPKEPFFYRNKMEFQFGSFNGRLSLAYGQRGRREKLSIERCILARKEIIEAVDYILEFLKGKGFEPEMLKTLVLRSGENKQVVAGVFTYLSKENFQERFGTFKEDLPLKGFAIFSSSALSPASIVSDVIYKRGEFELSWKLLGKMFKYGFFSFFQVNPEVFEMALKDILEFVEKGDRVVDFYSGVGVIGILSSDKASEVVLVEIDEEAVNFAKKNIEENGCKNVEAILSSVESALQFIEPNITLILDPNRPGLSKKVIKRILGVKPKKIIYLSCNLETQVRDLAYLLKYYRITFFKLYNFFPRTPHIESLVVLERR